MVPADDGPKVRRTSVQEFRPALKGFDMSDWTPSVTQAHGGVSPARDRTAGQPGAASTKIRRKFLDGDALAGMNVLLVDDDYRNLFAIKALLERTKAAVKIAASGPDAFYALQRTPDINIVLMDIMMPDMDGYEAIRKIRASGQFASLPIIAVTAKVNVGERERCLDAGASDYLPKPVNTEELLSAIQPWIPDQNQASA
jgi:CheY-like chemotaxis protein